MSTVMGGAITAGCRTSGDGGRITAGSKTVGDDLFLIKKIYSYINIAPFV